MTPNQKALVEAGKRISDLEIALEDVIEVLDSDEIKSVFAMQYVHGMEYKGPTIDVDKLRSLINRK